MKKLILVALLSVSLFSCEKAVEAKNFKTAYIDTGKLMDESIEAKDIEEKYKGKAAEMDGQLKAKASRLQNDIENFKQNAMSKGQVWAQQQGSDLQRREQELNYQQQGLLQQLQAESGKELDSVVKKYKAFFKDYGKEKGYDYIYGTGESATVLYAKDSYDLTNEIIKLLNEKYKSEGKKEEKPAVTADKK
jgi:outer membrane protein